MKYRIQIFILTIGVISFSCDKEELRKSDEFKGTWEWYSTCGGFVGCINAINYPIENQYKVIIDDFTIQTVASDGKTTTAYYQIEYVATQDNSKIFEIELDDGTRYNASVQDNFMTTSSEGGLPFSTTYKRIK